MIDIEKKPLEFLRIAGTEAAEPLVGSLLYIPVHNIKDLEVKVFENGSDPIAYDPDTHTGIVQGQEHLNIEETYSGVQIKLPKREEHIIVERVIVRSVNQKGEMECLPAFEIKYPDYDEEGDPEIKTFIVGALIPSLTLPNIGTFVANLKK